MRCVSCPPPPHPDPGPGGREPGGGLRPLPSALLRAALGNAAVLSPPGGTESGPDYHLQSPRLQQIWCGNLQDVERLKNPSFALSAWPNPAEISRLPTPWRDQGGRNSIARSSRVQLSWHLPGPQRRVPSVGGGRRLVGATVLFLESAAETGAGPDLHGFPKKWGMLAQAGSAFKTP